MSAIIMKENKYTIIAGSCFLLFVAYFFLVIWYPGYSSAKANGSAAACRHNMKEIEGSAELCFLEKAGTPILTVHDLVTKKYLKEES